MAPRRKLERCLNIEDLRELGRRRLPREVFDVIEGGHADETTLRANMSAYHDIHLFPRALADPTPLDTSTEVLGSRIAAPIILGPCSFLRSCHPEGEMAVARAAQQVGTVYVVPGGTGFEPVRVAKETDADLWYQIYLRPDAEVNERRLQEVADAGYRTLVITVDTPGKPFRERDLRNGVNTPIKVSPRMLGLGLRKPAWAFRFVAGNRGTGFSFEGRQQYLRFAEAITALQPVSLDQLRWVRERWTGSLVVKGVLRWQDVDHLLAEGVDGIVVSNHGGRNLDTTPPTIEVLPDVCAQVRGRVPVFIDGGIRRGSDVVKALALGASAVLVGRPYLYGLCAGGAPGVERAWTLLADEFQRTMYFLGLRSVDDLDATCVGRDVPAAPSPSREPQPLGGAAR